MLKTQELTLNLGPHHPSTHGVFRCVLNLEGEFITKAVNHIGYLHRGIEKIAESRTYTQFIPYNGRLDYVAGMLNEWAYVQAVEKLMGITEEIPERAEYLRVIMGELQRLASHAIYFASMALDVAGASAWFYGFRDRDDMLDLLEQVSGQRLMHNWMRIGGVASDVPEGWMERLAKLMSTIPDAIAEYEGILIGNEIFQARCKGVGKVSKEMALSYGFTGPNLRASGIDFDIRRDEPYSVYDKFKFEVPVRQDGDSFDRVIVRIEEMKQSVKIIEQAMNSIPDGPIMAKVPKVIKPEAGDCFSRLENAKGNLGFYIVSDGSTKPYRMHIYSPVFVNVGIFGEMAKGLQLMDAVVALASLDLVLGEIDR